MQIVCRPAWLLACGHAAKRYNGLIPTGADIDRPINSYVSCGRLAGRI